VPNDAARGRAHSEPGSTRPSRRPFLILGLVVGVVVLDQITKALVVASLADGPLSIIGNTVEFRLSRNPGGAFSILTGFTPLLAVLAAIVAVVLVRVAQRATDPVMVVALSLVLGGALGNLLDRLFRSPGFLEGAVVDFVHVGSFPTFNVADASICLGALLLAYDLVFEGKKKMVAVATYYPDRAGDRTDRFGQFHSAGPFYLFSFLTL